MRKILFALFAALMVVATPAPQARAQISDQEAVWVAQIANWSSDYFAVVQQSIKPMLGIPPAPMSGSKREIKQWVASARVWVAGARVSIAEARRLAALLPPPPSASGPPQLVVIFESQRRDLPAMIDSIEALVNQYELGTAAIERGDKDATLKHHELLIDAAKLVLQRSVIQARASIVPLTQTHPQRHLLLSAIASYEALLGQLDISREAVRGEPASRAAIAAKIRTAADTMRLETAAGRRRAAEMASDIAEPNALGPSQEALRLRLVQAVKTYGPQFDNEDEMASHFNKLADLLESGASYAAITEDVLAEMDAVGQLDLRRADMVHQRVVAIQTP